MATYTVKTAAITGTANTPVAVSGSDDFANDGNTFLYVENGGGSPSNVTINSVENCDQGFDHDIVVAVSAGTKSLIGPFTVARFGASASVTYSFTTSVTATAMRPR